MWQVFGGLSRFSRACSCRTALSNSSSAPRPTLGAEGGGSGARNLRAIACHAEPGVHLLRLPCGSLWLAGWAGGAAPATSSRDAWRGPPASPSWLLLTATGSTGRGPAVGASRVGR